MTQKEFIAFFHSKFYFLELLLAGGLTLISSKTFLIDFMHYLLTYFKIHSENIEMFSIIVTGVVFLFSAIVVKLFFRFIATTLFILKHGR